jgi:hypothetical protein
MKLLSYLFIFFFATTLFSCNSGNRNKVKEAQQTVIDETPASLATTEEQTKKKHDHSKFPEDFVLIATTASDTHALYFYPDNSLMLNDFHNNSFGTWKLKNDTIVMTFTKNTGRIGYGEDLLVGANVPDWEFYYYYEEDYFYEECIAKSDILNYYIIDTNRFASNFDKENFKHQSSGKYVFASMRTLDSLELTKYTGKELRIMRNEIFARYGFIFKSEDLKQHFGSQKWYSPERENVDKFVTDLEKSNLELIVKV